MPIYEVVCEQCGLEKEILTLRISEPLPICKCGGEYKILPSKVTWRWALNEGCWQKIGNQWKYEGPGGPKRILGGEKLNVHDNMPMYEHEQQAIARESTPDQDEGEVFSEIDESTIPEGVERP